MVAHGLLQADVNPAARYLNGFIFVKESARLMESALRRAEATISAYGLVVNPEKTEGPAQRIASYFA